MHPAVAFCDVMAILLWLFGFFKMVYNIFKYWEIRAFYQTALKIPQVCVRINAVHNLQYYCCYIFFYCINSFFQLSVIFDFDAVHLLALL